MFISMIVNVPLPPACLRPFPLHADRPFHYFRALKFVDRQLAGSKIVKRSVRYCRS